MLTRSRAEYSLVELVQLIATENYLDVGVQMELQRRLEDEVQAQLCQGKTVRVGGYFSLKRSKGGKLRVRSDRKLQRLCEKLE